MAQQFVSPKQLMVFDRNDLPCGYCGFDPRYSDEHRCDGFGHSVNAQTGEVYGGGCRNCRDGYGCEHFDELVKEYGKD